MLIYLIAAAPFHARIFTHSPPRWFTEVETLPETDADLRATHMDDDERRRRFATDLADYLDALGTPADPAGIILAAPTRLFDAVRRYLHACSGCRLVATLRQDLTRAHPCMIDAVAREALAGSRQWERAAEIRGQTPYRPPGAGIRPLSPRGHGSRATP